ncbi:MAG: UbiD family decarboxylase [Candidatus Micrarchaeia archaeon]
MINDLKEFIKYLETKKRLLKIPYTVDTDLEITAFTDRACMDKNKKTLFFQNVKDFNMPIVTNLFIAKDTLDELVEKNYLFDLITLFNNQKDKPSLIKSAKLMLNFKPKIIESKLNKYEKLNSLDELPVLKVWPNDAGRFITQPLVITQDPIDKSLNVGIYRMQIYDKFTTGMHWQAMKGGAIHANVAKENNKIMNISVVIGSDPYNLISAIAPLPQGFNEFSFSGILRNSKTLLMKNGKYPMIPANSEIVINGYVDPNELKEEGPFGDHTGYYSIPELYPVFHVESIFAKKGAIYSASIVGFPRHEDANIGSFLVDMFKPMLKMINDNIIDLYMPPEGNFTNTCFVSIKKRFPGEAKKIMFSILGTSQLEFAKIIIAFDDDINIRNLNEVIWALSTRIDPQRDITIIPNTIADSLDHATNLPSLGSKVLIDATKKTKAEGYVREWPETISLPKEIIKEVEKKWDTIKQE